ncbi:tetratricopeptide repeat protein [Deferrisoma palaeochoriense]
MLNERLRRFREEGGEPLVPIWIETLPPEEALVELRGREGPVFRIQEARFLGLLGRADEAREVLAGLGELPRGLALLRDAVAAELGEAKPRTEEPEPEAAPIASKTLAEIYARQGDVDGAVAMYREVLARNPDDVEARERLRELLGREARPAEAGLAARLEAWLGRVRAWRRVLGV